jgi:peptidoglycan/xylan/chitin deacetylase (PgdA/CDA1 family)
LEAKKQIYSKQKVRIWLALLCITLFMYLDVYVAQFLVDHPSFMVGSNQQFNQVALIPKEVLMPPEPSSGIHEIVDGNQSPNINNPPIALPVGQMVNKIPGNRKVVYLTFDDGPNEYTRQIVDVLDRYKVKATFFWVGQNVLDKELAQEVVQKGHVIGTHSMQHTMMRNKSRQEQIQIINASTNYVSKMTGSPIYYFRPPYGAVDGNTMAASIATGQILISWSVDTKDWMYQNNHSVILNNIRNEVSPGGIILMHERPQTTQYLPKVIQLLKSMGYECLPLPNPKGKAA